MYILYQFMLHKFITLGRNSSNIDPGIVSQHSQMLYMFNTHDKSFKCIEQHCMKVTFVI